LFEAVVRDRTDRVVVGLAGVEALDPKQPQKALLAIGEQFLTLVREEDTLGHFRSLYGAAGAQREACLAFHRQGPDKLIGDLAAYLRRADAAGTLNIRHPRQAADLFLSMFLGDGHIRGLMMLDMPDARENRALLREAVRVFIAAYAKAP
jgi:TetR/AcrR family transcriptional repressor of mexJK operon